MTTPASAPSDGFRAELRDVGGLAWGLLLALGIVTLILGGMVLAWPEATLTVLGVLFGLWLLAAGVLRLLAALLERTVPTGWRVVHGLLGVALIVAGVVTMTDVVATLSVLVVLAGLLFFVDGVDDLVRAARGAATGSRWWLVLTGLLGLLAGGILLANPRIGLATLVVVLGAMLLMLGATRIIAALSLRQLVREI